MDENAELSKLLSEQQQPSLLVAAEDKTRKTLVLSAASLFEHRITEVMLRHADEASGSDSCITSLIRNKAIKRQFHTFFDWENQRPGPFFTLLGDRIGTALKGYCGASPGKEQVAAFLEVGNLRNCLVHQNYATYVIEKSATEIGDLCRNADAFVSEVENAFALARRERNPQV